MQQTFIGLMSGTSLDGVDGVIAEFSDPKPRVLRHVALPFDTGLKEELTSLNSRGDDELHRAALAANQLARRYAQVVESLLESTGVTAVQIAAIGAHGQTVRHRPREFDGTGYTLQINNPALLAELTGIPVIADFRSRDVAAGGHGAPLVPAFHRTVFADPGHDVAVLNVGGIANLSILGANGHVTGFDCGPGNGMMDLWCQIRTGQPFDADGAWAASGRVIGALLADLLAEPYFQLAPPKSTGRDLFNAQWLALRLSSFPQAAPADIQATLNELTAASVEQSLAIHGLGCKTLVVCGGGALNCHLMRRLAALLPGVKVENSAAHGLPPLQVEATAFAWLARQALLNRPTELCKVTGARGDRVLGAVYPA